MKGGNVGKVGKVGKVGTVGKVGKVGRVGEVDKVGKEGRLREYNLPYLPSILFKTSDTGHIARYRKPQEPIVKTKYLE